MKVIVRALSSCMSWLPRLGSLVLVLTWLMAPSATARHVRELLRPDGTLNLETGFSGSLDVSGFSVVDTTTLYIPPAVTATAAIPGIVPRTSIRATTQKVAASATTTPPSPDYLSMPLLIEPPAPMATKPPAPV